MRTLDQIYGPEVYFDRYGTYQGYTGTKEQLDELEKWSEEKLGSDGGIRTHDDRFEGPVT